MSQAVIPLQSIQIDDVTLGVISYLNSRGISEDTIRMAGITSGTKNFREGGVLECVGYTYRGVEGNNYAVKWRSIEGKYFTQQGAAQTLYMADKITQDDYLVICEGELDCLSFFEVGIEATSVPSGALQQNENSDSARLRFMAHHDDLLKKAKAIYIATDMDGPGQITANELARRVGKAKSWRVDFPPGCKDANDTLMKHGKEALVECFQKAEAWPVEGLAMANDYLTKVQQLYTSGLPRGVSTGLPSVDELFTLNPGNLVIVTGIPGHGKSAIIDTILMNAMKEQDWRVAYASFENPQPIHISKLIAQKVDRPFGDGPTPRMTEQEMLDAMSWVNDHVSFLTNEGVMPTPESLIERFETTVRRYGVKACVCDPFNYIDLATTSEGGINTEAVNGMLAKFKMFAERTETVFFLVAHPAKPQGGNTDFVPGGYSISSSAHFFNKADFGLTQHRKGDQSFFHCWKAKFAHQGKTGVAELRYDKPTGGFKELVGVSQSDPSQWNVDFLNKQDDPWLTEH